MKEIVHSISLISGLFLKRFQKGKSRKQLEANQKSMNAWPWVLRYMSTVIQPIMDNQNMAKYTLIFSLL